jgi:hypothetical protein
MPHVEPVQLPDPAEVKRINVAVSPAAIRDIQHMMAAEHLNLTEAVRRLLGYGAFVYRKIKDEGYGVELHRDGEVRAVELIN